MLQAAVPKSMQLELEKPTSTTISNAGGSVTQILKVTNPSKAALKMRLKLNYSKNGTDIQDQMEVNNFPPTLFS
jgi:AP-1 complex subunit gamma-1